MIAGLLPALVFSVFGYLLYALAIAPIFGFSAPLEGAIPSMQQVWNVVLCILAVDVLFVVKSLMAVRRNGILLHADHLVLRRGIGVTFGCKVSYRSILYKDILRMRIRTWKMVHPAHCAEVRFLVQRKNGSFERLTIDNIEHPTELKRWIEEKRKQCNAASDGVTDLDFMR